VLYLTKNGRSFVQKLGPILNKQKAEASYRDVNFGGCMNTRKRSLLTMGIFASLLGLIGCDPTWDAERRRLQPENFEKITVGMPELEVVQILGKPHQTVTYDLKPSELNYQWRWRNTTNRAMFFGVVFDPDKVVIRTATWLDTQDASNASG
jgi:hypothetical protein